MSQKSRRSRRGQVLVASVLGVCVLAGMAALTVDVGYLCLTNARLQNAADAASLAATYVLLSERLEGAGEQSARTAALIEANLIGRANVAEAGISVQFGCRNEAGSFLVADSATEATAARVTMFRDQDAPGGALALFFAPVFGLQSARVSAAATCEASSDIAGVLGGLSPFGVPQSAIPPVGEEMIFYPVDGNDYDGLADSKVAPGCWGLLNLDGGNLGTPELIDWIVNGYDGTIRKDPEQDSVWIDGTSGFRATIEDAMIQKIGKPMILLVYDQIVGVGATTDFRCVGFLRITVNSVQLKGTNNPHISATVEQVSSLHDVITGGGVPSVNIRKVQLVE